MITTNRDYNMDFCKINVGLYVKDKPEELMPIEEVNFEENVFYLKQTIAEKIQDDALNLDIIYNGNLLNDEEKLNDILKPNAMVFCIRKQLPNKEYVTVMSENEISESALKSVQDLFNMISRTQINVNSRVNILQTIVSEYPEFRRNLGAQAFIRDSVLFGTLNKLEILKTIAKHYPIIIKAAPFIVDTVKKEITRENFAPTTEALNSDSTNSSEEENFTGPNSTGDNRNPTESRAISRRQLQAALAQIGYTREPGSNSVNSLSNIAERNLGENINEAAPITNSESGERISAELFRTELQRALNSISNVDPSVDVNRRNLVSAEVGANASISEDDGDIPARYRDHQYADELRIMAQMGFVSYDENISYLNITNGNIEDAINLLMASMT